MAHDDLRLDTALEEILAQREAKRLHADEVDLLLVEPARVVFAKSVGGDERLALEGKRIGFEIVLGGTKHTDSFTPPPRAVWSGHVTSDALACSVNEIQWDTAK